MKKIALLALVAFIAWNYYTKHGASMPGFLNSHESASGISYKKQGQQFRCDGRQYCSQMRSYAEAKFFIDNCPDTKMDGDYDGIPCERQFGR